MYLSQSRLRSDLDPFLFFLPLFIFHFSLFHFSFSFFTFSLFTFHCPTKPREYLLTCCRHKVRHEKYTCLDIPFLISNRNRKKFKASLYTTRKALEEQSGWKMGSGREGLCTKTITQQG